MNENGPARRAAKLCSDCGQPSIERPRCVECEAKHREQYGWQWTKVRRAYLAAHPQDRHGQHRYTLAAAGLYARVERERYAGYVRRFGVAEEAVE